jgi:hypothetical protein
MHTRLFASPSLGLELNSVEQSVERCIIYLDMPSANFIGLGNAVGPMIKPFVKEAHSRRLSEKNLQGVTASSEEQEKRPAANIVASALKRETCQSIERQPHVDWLQCNENLNSARNHAAP